MPSFESVPLSEKSSASPSIDSILLNYVGRGREALLPVLWDVQTAFGWIDRDAVMAISRTLRVPATEIYGVVEFYSQFHDQPIGKTHIAVCTSPICAILGADAHIARLCQHLHVQPDAVSDDGAYTVSETTCLGLCDHAPAALISVVGEGEFSYAPLSDADSLLNDVEASRSPVRQALVGAEQGYLLPVSDSPFVQRETLAEYGDYAALRTVLANMPPAAFIAEVEASNLIGRGGAAFPTGLKWKYTRAAPAQPHYLVCNADESEPGTFKDRVLMEMRPHLLIEGMALAGYAVGAGLGYLFVRGEYPEAYRSLQAAVDEARAAGLLGANLFGTEVSFDIELRRGAGAYICGEETALFEAVEGKRGFPRVKPPFPTTHGLFGKPTAVNNVETLCAIPLIATHGAAWFRGLGTEGSAGTKLVAVSGHIQRPGVYEIAPGMTLRTLLDELCGGIVGDLRAVLMGGAAGTFLAPHEIDVALGFETLRAVGSTFGSGAIMVFNTTTDMRDVLKRLGRFFQHESCGKCFPCQLGTQRQFEILERLYQPLAGDSQRLHDVGWTMTDSSLCGLGQTAASAVLSAMARFPELFEQTEGSQ
jgi:NADH-quinone oxidoreductase subunit F